MALFDKETMKKMGYEEVAKLIEKGICPECKEKVDLNSFSDDFYKLQFELCGYCEKCTKKMMDIVVENIHNMTCFKCGKRIDFDDFLLEIEVDTYFNTACCPKCQRKIVEKLEGCVDENAR